MGFELKQLHTQYDPSLEDFFLTKDSCGFVKHGSRLRGDICLYR